jgi:nucleoid-associated protein YgaU
MDKAKLVNKLLPFEMVVFDINPKAVKMSKGQDLARRGTAGQTNPTGSSPPIWRHTYPTKLTLTEVYIDGMEVKNRADLIFSWVQPGGSFFGKLAGAALSALSGGRINLAVKPPTLVFQWGPPAIGFMMDCVLTAANIDFTRFDSSGIPTRMKIASLELTEVPNPLLHMLTNPTSGGVPGRESHRVIAGENLQTISERTYGSPQYWRAVADANGIDDPLRLRPGDLVYLPSPQDIVAAGPAGV